MTVYAEAITVGDLLVKGVAEHGETESLVFPDARLTNKDLLQGAMSFARGLYGLGVRRGDHVGILMPNCPEFAQLLFAVAMLGAVSVPINARYRRKELAYVVENADLACLVTSDLIVDRVDYVQLLTDSLPSLASADNPESLDLPEAPRLRSIVLIGSREAPGVVSQKRFQEISAQVDPAVVEVARARVRLRDVAMIVYTSGTTADPKGCLLTHEGLVRQWIAGGVRFEVRPGDKFWNPLPMFHLSGIGPLLFCVGLGATMLSMTRFEPDAALDQIVEEQATHLYPCFPTVAMGVLRHPRYDRDAMRHVRVHAMVAPPDTRRLVQRLLPEGARLTSAFGLTECCGTVVANKLDETEDQRCETSGPPIEGIEIRISDPETGAERPTGEVGEIWVRGFSVFEGYHKDPEKTAATLLPDGWCRTGDLGKLNADGLLTYVGRLKEMLKVGGENVAPAEIEDHLNKHPSVKLAVVVGRPDERYQEVPVAFVELLEGATATEEELIEFCRGQLASFKLPREVRFVTEWPMSATKIQRFKLLEMLEDGKVE